MWALSKKLETLLCLCGNGNQTAFKNMLELQHFIISKIYVYAVTYGEHLMIVDDSDVKYPTSNDCKPVILNIV